MRARLMRGKFALLFIVFAALLLAVAGTTMALTADPSGTTAPTIQSDKDDYAPGETVTLTGSNWQPGESVHITVNDDVGQTWSRDADVTADANGQIQDQFQLPNWFVATYKVTATGAQSGVATTTFTDGNVKVKSASGLNYGFTYRGFTGSTNCTTGGGTTQTGTGDSNGQNVASSSGESVLITANTNANAPNGSSVFINWSNPDGLNITSGNLNTRAICVEGFANGSKDLIGNYGRQTTTSVTPAGPPSSTYGNNFTFTATVAASGGNPSGVGTVTFKDGPNVISGCSAVPLSGNTATCTTTKLSAGGHPITAEYSGTTTGSPLFSSSTSVPFPYFVTPAAQR
jgi:Bacterial Ig-like domain (group 3)